MIPAAVASQLEDGLRAFLRSSLWSPTADLDGLVERFLKNRQAAWKGPWVDLKLPFVEGSRSDAVPGVPLPFTPHAHQEAAFDRLSGRRKLSTLVATGTGSGKTEAFLVPILAHCLEEAGRTGVKAVIIYPMNALATDQALRIARTIHGNKRLNGVVTAGLYVGQDRSGGAIHTSMGPDHLITDRDVLRREPPDLLLTNYKMLDYLLLRPDDQPLWRHNERGVLRFLVVDELHTFDGAQGTDLACLVRRFKRRLEADDGSLCCVGTSATLGGGEGAADRLLSYARRVFGEPFAPDAIVTEQRVSAVDFLAGTTEELVDEPDIDDDTRLAPGRYPDPQRWVRAQAALWLSNDAPDPNLDADAWAVALGDQLKRHAVFRQLVKHLDARPLPLEDLVAALARGRTRWLQHPDLGRASVLSLLGLVSAARRWRPELPERRAARERKGEPRPTQAFLDVRLQTWQRELARLVASVGQAPSLAFSDDLDRAARRRHLPLVRCSDCGALGWGSLLDRDRPRNFACDPKRFYRGWFGRDPRVRLLYPAGAVPAHAAGWEDDSARRLDTTSLREVRQGEDGFEDAYPVRLAPNTRTVQRDDVPVQESHQDCPFCGGVDRLLITGFRTATLTSVTVDQLFGSPFNDDKRLLAFSDSVQDASHRAGFLGARTWRTNLRIAAAQALPEDGSGVPLDTLADEVVAYWRGPRGLDDRQFLSTFLAPDMAWLHDWDHLRREGKLPPDSNLVELVQRRLAWELVGEAGMWAARGRSLERVGAAATQIAPDRFEAALDDLLEPLRNEVGGLRALDRRRLAVFLFGLLHRMRLQGGVVHDVIPRGFLQSGGSRFVLGTKMWLPPTGKRSRLPVLLADRTGTPRFTTWAAPRSWYRAWVDRALLDGALGPDANDVYPVVLPGLEAAELLQRVEGHVNKSRPFTAWGLRADALSTTREAHPVACSQCGARYTAAGSALDRWLGHPCPNAGCRGELSHTERPVDYFARLYATGDLQRVFAEEHTGLLNRKQREDVEQRFKAPFPPDDPSPDDDETEWRDPWDPNLLSCTPTLEMGIDVGDLSSAVLCSVPPAPANYLQRIGRAGRRDGNAFVITVANARPHDRYFWAQPEEMLDGEVEPPGLYLDAAAVLERHLAAFCLDRWVASQGDDADLPKKLSSVLDAVRTKNAATFPYTFFSFVESRQAQLLREFLEMFATKAVAEISDRTEAALGDFLTGQAQEGGLVWKLLSLFESEHKQIKGLERDIKRLQADIRLLQGATVPPKDLKEQLEALEAEKATLQRLAREARNRQLLEFLTDFGFLPNYAFPEAAVRLQTVIWRRRKTPAAGKPYETWQYDYVRAPASAISELVPNARFYAGGRKVQIDRVDMSSHSVESWRFCPSCSHAEHIDSGDPNLVCPACGDTHWADPDQAQRLLQLRQVYASASDRRSRITDDVEERRPLLHLRQMLVDVSDAHSIGRWALKTDKTTFALEFLTRASFREVNFGDLTSDGAKSEIAGEARVRPGFRVCTRCGTVQRSATSHDHAKFCTFSKADATPLYEDALYLYRSFRSEALRILLPVTDTGDTMHRDSFLAALNLGLRLEFGGRLDHLRATLVSAPIPESSLRKQLLVLFDTVPGGTGYLEQVVRRDEGGRMQLFAALEKARDRIVGCRCRSTSKDGCYRCILGYHNSRTMDGLSARVAEQMLTRILDQEDTLDEIDSFDGVSVQGLLDSALEVRFIEALRQVKVRAERVDIRLAVLGTRTGYQLSVGDRHWTLHPQIELGRADGLPMVVSIDFVLRPQGGDSGTLPIAVFLDGWTYHHDRLGKDLLQRQLLHETGRWDTWSLTWNDLDEVLLKDPGPAPEVLPAAALSQAATGAGSAVLARLADASWFEVLVGTLGQERPPRWDTFAAHLAKHLASVDPIREAGPWTKGVNAMAPAELRPLLQPIEPTLSASLEPVPGVRVVLGYARPELHLLVHVDDRWDADDTSARRTWWAALRLWQLLRALPNLWFITHRGPEETWSGLAQLRQALPASWVDEALAGELLDPEYESLARALAKTGAQPPTFGHDLKEARGRILGMAEFAWVDRQLGLVEVNDPSDVPSIPGWTLLPLTDPEDVDGVLALLSDAGVL